MRTRTKVASILFIFLLLWASFYYLGSTATQGQNVLPIYAPQNFTVNHTYISISGLSSFDPYDRVISIYYYGTEIIRIITPLHRDGSLPDSFNHLIEVPFSLPQIYTTYPPAFTWTVFNNQNLWTVNITVVHVANKPAEALVSLIPFSQTPPTAYQFWVPNDGIGYFLISGHSSLEGATISVKIDNTTYTVQPWHPLNNDAILTTTGLVIPYINGDNGVMLSKGMHTLSILTTQPYVLVSAFEVYNETIPPPSPRP
jgi:hypothetical protein